MKNRMLILVLFIIARLSVLAQHCQYCTASIVGINPISGTSKQTINGLYIFVVNEKGIQYNGLNSVVDPVPTYNEKISKTVLFWQNDSTKAPNKNDRKHFNFARNHYLFSSFWSISSSIPKDKLYIRIEDRDGNKNGGKFKTQVIPVSQLKLKLLCGYDDSYFKSDDYAPLTIELEAVKARDSTKIIKTANGFRFEFDPSPLANCPECEGCICKSIQVFNSLEQLVFERIFVENTLEDNYLGIDSIQVADYNFDGYPDFRIFSGFSKISKFYVYVPAKNKFEREPMLSRLANLSFNNEKQIAQGTIFDTIPHVKSGKHYNGSSFVNAYTLSGKNLVNVMIASQFWYNPWNGYYPPMDSNRVKRDHIDTCYYQYFDYEFSEINSSMLYKTKKEFGDYNFDGYEDFRTKKNENDERWDFFIYNNKKQSFEIDTLLSKMSITDFDFENKVFVGQITKHINELDTYTEGYKTVNGRIILYSKSTCHREFRFAEKVDYTISELKDGKWVETFIHGAE